MESRSGPVSADQIRDGSRRNAVWLWRPPEGSVAREGPLGLLAEFTPNPGAPSL